MLALHKTMKERVNKRIKQTHTKKSDTAAMHDTLFEACATWPGVAAKHLAETNFEDSEDTVVYWADETAGRTYRTVWWG